MDSKKLLIVSHGSALGGSPISALNIGRHIDRERFEPIFLFGEHRDIDAVAKKEGFKTYVVANKGFLGLNLIAQTIKIILKEKIDIVHLNTLTSYYKYPAIAAKLFGKKVAWFVRENPEEKRCIRLKHYLNALADRIVTVSYDTAEHIGYADKGKLMTIHNGLNQEYGRLEGRTSLLATLGLSGDYEYITTIASLEGRKGVLDIIDAFALIAEKFPTYRLLIVGEDRTKEQDYLQQIKNKINTLNLDEKVILYGKSSQVNALLSITTVFVLASYWEGLSRVLLEAMACSLPIVASDAGGNREQVVDGVNGYLFTPKQPVELAEKLSELIGKNQFETFGKSSRRLFEERFDIAVTIEKIETLYASLL